MENYTEELLPAGFTCPVSFFGVGQVVSAINEVELNYFLSFWTHVVFFIYLMFELKDLTDCTFVPDQL